MSKFFSLFSRNAEKPAAVAGLSAQPLVVTEGEPASAPHKIEHAKYRLDAIKRSVEQNGAQLTKEHMQEFKAEIRDHAHTLVKAGVITDEQAAELVRDGKGATL